MRNSNLRDSLTSFKILNKQDKHIQFTIEDENGEKCLNFLDIKIKNNDGRYRIYLYFRLISNTINKSL